ncbi:ATP-binding protein [Thioalkalivibrio thiocyanodenitrificans]|uniref:ATP-binding protein n=1 Tax=Thioalkalivibrio thiocyanodenitrificans TaxID=243063 RepID=UPI000365336D|nr:ATP-binding protein [Thioalkalivibrio thiocyanodenitrificans]
MKGIDLTREIEANLDTDVSEFPILATAHAYKVLSSSLYSDKTRAVLRELGCNAMDAHIEAGKPDMPFEVKLPNSLDPSFYIKDWGEGMGPAQIRNVFVVYFASTKGSAMEQTGEYGLGCKSPFSYTDSFTITSVRKGVKRVFVAYLDEEGKPCLRRLTRTPMRATEDWKSGTMVSFPVRQGDFKTFSDKARQVFRWFSVKPRILGVPVDLDIGEIVHEDDRVMRFHSGSGFGKPQVLMGNVAYPFDLSEIGFTQRASELGIFALPDEEVAAQSVRSPLNIGEEGELVVKYDEVMRERLKLLETALFKAFGSSSIVIKMPIGGVKVPPSRETLEYDEITQRTLALFFYQRLLKAADWVRALLEDESTPPWPRRNKLYTSGSNGYVMGYIPCDCMSQLAKAFGLRNQHLLERVVAFPGWAGDETYGVRLIGGDSESVNQYDVAGGHIRKKDGSFYPKYRPAQLSTSEKAAIVVADRPGTARLAEQLLQEETYSQLAYVYIKKCSGGDNEGLCEIARRLEQHFGEGLPVIYGSQSISKRSAGKRSRKASPVGILPYVSMDEVLRARRGGLTLRSFSSEPVDQRKPGRYIYLVSEGRTRRLRHDNGETPQGFTLEKIAALIAGAQYHYEDALSGIEGVFLITDKKFAKMALPEGFISLRQWWSEIYEKGPLRDTLKGRCETYFVESQYDEFSRVLRLVGRNEQIRTLIRPGLLKTGVGRAFLEASELIRDEDDVLRTRKKEYKVARDTLYRAVYVRLLENKDLKFATGGNMMVGMNERYPCFRLAGKLDDALDALPESDRKALPWQFRTVLQAMFEPAGTFPMESVEAA